MQSGRPALSQGWPGRGGAAGRYLPACLHHIMWHKQLKSHPRNTETSVLPSISFSFTREHTGEERRELFAMPCVMDIFAQEKLSPRRGTLGAVVFQLLELARGPGGGGVRRCSASAALGTFVHGAGRPAGCIVPFQGDRV